MLLRYLCRKGFKISYLFVHLFCLKDKKQANKIVFLLAKVSFTQGLLRVTLINALPNVVRSLRVFRFLPTRNVDRVVRIIKI